MARQVKLTSDEKEAKDQDNVESWKNYEMSLGGLTAPSGFAEVPGANIYRKSRKAFMEFQQPIRLQLVNYCRCGGREEPM